MNRTFLWLGAAGGFTAVALGAFGAHGLKGRLSPDMLAVFETGVRYHMYHALALVAVALVAGQMGVATKWTSVAGWCFAAGVVFFSGSLYVLALSGMTILGAVAPIGGTAMILGWMMLAWGSMQSRPSGS